MRDVFQLQSEDGTITYKEPFYASVSARRYLRRLDGAAGARIEAIWQRRRCRFRVPLQMRHDRSTRQANAYSQQGLIVWMQYNRHDERGQLEPSPIQDLAAYAGQVPDAIKQIIFGLWRARHSGLSALGGRRKRLSWLRLLRIRHGPKTKAKPNYRAIQFRRSLRTVKLFLGKSNYPVAQSANSAPSHLSRTNAGQVGMGDRNGHPLFHVGREVEKGLVHRPGADGASANLLKCGLNLFADQRDTTTITKRINGGLNGLAQRLAFTNIARGILA